ncbi:MAG: ExbD/TolR family protein [Acidobacteriota bacterium]|nr:ExbD/TolR family protein [Acidobacteriota bacterium]
MAFSTNQQGPSTSLSEINVTPLVDVMLVLLIIFMISAPLMQTGVTLELPLGNENLKQREDFILLSINAEGKHFLNDDYLQPEVILEKVKAKIAVSPDKTVYLRGDQGLTYGTVMSLVNQLKEAGIEEISLVTEPPKQS